MKPRLLILTVLLTILAPCAPGREACAQTTGAAVNLTPETIGEKTSMADFVVVGEVKSVGEVPGQRTSVSRPLLPEMTAEVEVLEVLKGAMGEKKIVIEFKRSERPSRPPRPDLAVGETAVLFLRLKPGGATFEFISPFAGKEPAGAGVEEQVADAVAGGGQTADLSAVLRLGGADFPAGGPVAFNAVISNDGGIPVTIYTYIVPGRDIVITGGDGTQVAPRATPARAAPSPAPAGHTGLRREHFTTLQPGQFIGLRGDLAADFALTGPGAYTAAFILHCAPGKEAGAIAWNGTIVSPGVSFTIGGE